MLGCLSGGWMGSKCQCVSHFFIHNGSQNLQKYVSVHNFKSESFLGTLNSMVGGEITNICLYLSPSWKRVVIFKELAMAVQQAAASGGLVVKSEVGELQWLSRGSSWGEHLDSFHRNLWLGNGCLLFHKWVCQNHTLFKAFWWKTAIFRWTTELKLSGWFLLKS